MIATPPHQSIPATQPPRQLPQAATASRVRLGSLALAVAGVLFVVYPALRPFSDEASLEGAAAFASTAWLAAHLLAMLGFLLTTLGLLGLHLALQDTPAERRSFWALVVWWIGAGLTLSFYGAEAFGLHAIGRWAIADGSAALVGMAGEVRSGAGLVMFLAGLVLLATGAVMTATAVWRSRRLFKWSGLPFALGFALFVPQFFGAQPVRVAHGLLVAAGCLWLAAGMWARTREVDRTAPGH